MWHVRGRRGMQGFEGGKMKEQVHLENLSIDERIILNLILKNYNGVLWIVAIWLSD
jgi:hypothetical protein